MNARDSDKGKGRRKHGFATLQARPSEYSIWSTMRRRCLTKTDRRFPLYGGRGITICERWNDFANFYADMGPRPSSKHSIERINNDGGYSPENCKWATQIEQANNQRSNHRITINGETFTISQLARASGIPRPCLRMRILRNTPIADLLKPSGALYGRRSK